MAALSEISLNSPHKSTIEEDLSACTISDDPLGHPEAIVVVKQSLDSTINIDEGDEANSNNLSNWSFSNPARNLMGAFEDTEERLLLAKESWSPNGVDFTFSIENGTPTKKDSSSVSFQSLKIELPRFHLYKNLKRDLPQPVVDRCSFYSVIHGVNKEIQDMAEQDSNCAKELTVDEDSALVQAIKGSPHINSHPKGCILPLAVLDEELFLLAAISSRGDEEKLSINPNNCPATFSEAIGELDCSSFDGSAQSENPLAALSNSRTQLWKPSRSWWEAKSGKNPWIEPRLHNKRWRFLWPLIHYHKFLAKCIKKLKRNNVDVKTSISPVSVFLREEVCAVSDHLGNISNFTSEEWMEALPNFYGWTDTSDEGEEKLREIVNKLPIRPLQEPSDVDSELLRSQIDHSFLVAMDDARKQMASGGDDYVRNESFPDTSVSMKYSNTLREKHNVSSKRPPRPNISNHKKSTQTKGLQSNRRKMKNMEYDYGYNPNYSMLYPYAPSVQNMYAVPNMYIPYQTMPSVGYPIPTSHGYYTNNWVGNPEYSYCDPNQSMRCDNSQNASFYAHNGWNQYVATQNLDCSVFSLPVEDVSFAMDVTSAPDGVSLSFLGPPGEVKQTPVKNTSQIHPSSPHWDHLAQLTMNGVSSPSTVYNQHSTICEGYIAQPLLLQNNLQPSHQDPPSPATQFLMSSHDNKTYAFQKDADGNKCDVEGVHEEKRSSESVTAASSADSESP